MTKTKRRTLAIDPGTREIGFALLEDDRLVYHGVETIKKCNSMQEMLNEGRKIIQRLINDYRPDTLAVVKKVFVSNRRSVALNLFAVVTMATGRREGLEVVCYAPSTVKKFITGNGRASKLEVAKVVIAEFPELKVYLTQDRKWKQRYHLNMFDAVALGIMAVND